MALSKQLQDFVLSERTFFHVASQELKVFQRGKQLENEHKIVTNNVLEALDSPYFFDWEDDSDEAKKEQDAFRRRYKRAKIQWRNDSKNKGNATPGLSVKVFISNQLYKHLMKPKQPLTFLVSDDSDSDYDENDENDMEVDETEEDEEEESMEVPEQPEQRTPTGRPKEPFKGNSTRQQKAKTDACMKFFQETADDLEITFEELLSYFGMRHAYENGDFEKGNFFKKWFKEGISNQMESTTISMEKAIYLKEKLRLSRNKYVELRDMFKGKPVVLPTKHAMKDYLDAHIKPKLEEYMDGTKGTFSDLLQRTVSRILEGIGYVHNYQRLTVKVATGFDGSGSHKQKGGQTIKRGINTKNKVLGGFRVVTIHDHYGNLLFEEKSQAASSLRPWFILNANESHANVKKIATMFEKEILEVLDIPFQVKYGDDDIQTYVKAGLFMDSKLINLVTGLGGCYCSCCTASTREGNTLTCIQDGFPMNRSQEQLNSDYERLEKAGVFKRKTLPSDYKIRYGLTKPPMFKRLDATKVRILLI